MDSVPYSENFITNEKRRPKDVAPCAACIARRALLAPFAGCVRGLRSKACFPQRTAFFAGSNCSYSSQLHFL